MRLKTTEEKSQERHRQLMKKYKRITDDYNAQIEKGMSKSDAVVLTANIHNCTLPTVYRAKKTIEKELQWERDSMTQTNS